MESERKEQLASLLLIVFSAGICLMTSQLGIGSLHKPGSGFFPFWGAAVLGLLSLANFLVATRERRRAVEKIKSREEGIRWKNLFLTFSFLLVYPFLLDTLGFLLSTFLFFFLLLRFIEPRRWPVVLGLSASVAILAFLIFQYWLRMQFPSGIFGI
jgi:putative tricarboxylic transport membrane protein